MNSRTKLFICLQVHEIIFGVFMCWWLANSSRRTYHPIMRAVIKQGQSLGHVLHKLPPFSTTQCCHLGGGGSEVPNDFLFIKSGNIWTAPRLDWIPCWSMCKMDSKLASCGSLTACQDMGHEKMFLLHILTILYSIIFYDYIDLCSCRSILLYLYLQ